MIVTKIRLRWTPGALFQVWQKRDGFRTIALEDVVEIDDVPVEDVAAMHAAVAAALGLSCRPRTFDEMMAGHTRDALALLDPASVWTLTVEVARDDDVLTSVHATSADAWDAFRATYGKGRDDLDDDDLTEWLQVEHEIEAHIEEHEIPAVRQSA